MKRLLLTLCVLFSLSAMGDTRTKRAVFNFSNPESLSPSVPRSESAGGATYITGKEFHSSDGFIALSFDNTMTNPRSNIEIVTSGDRSTCYLTFHRNALMTISSVNKNGTHPLITNIQIPGSDNLGGLTLTDTGTPSLVGMLDMSEDQMWYEWSGQGNTVRSVTFQNQSPSSPALHALVVSYELPRDVLSESSYNYIGQTSKSELSSFDGIQIEFPDNMTLKSDANISLSDGTPLSTSVDGKVITITPSKSITVEGQYTLTIGAGSFADASDYRNVELKFTFSVVEPFTFSISPIPGEVEADELTSITLTFDGVVANVDKTLEVNLYEKNNLTNYVRSGFADYDGTSKVKIKFNNNTAIDKNGIYTLIIPAGLVTSNAGRKNIQTTCDYNIGNIASDEERNYAMGFLNLMGIGYPSSTAKERTRLSSLLNSTSPKSDELSTALSNFIRTDDIEMPVSGSYYYISAVSSKADRCYLTCNPSTGSVNLTTNSSEAMPIKVVRQTNGDYTFQTSDGLFLLLPGVSNTGLTTAVNPLTLRKLSFEGIDEKAAFGLFSINDVSMTYALANVERIDFATSSQIAFGHFSSTLTNGFAFEAVPESAIPVPDVQYTLSPESNSSMPLLTSVTISFPTLPEVNLADASKVVLRHSSGTTVQPTTIRLVEGSKNSYIMKFADVISGSHTLIIGKGAFTYSYTSDNNTQINASVQAIQSVYTVTTGDDFQYDFTGLHSIYYKEDIIQDIPVKDTYLNHMTFYSYDTEIGVSSQEVLIVNFNTNKEVARGHFVKVDADESIPGAKSIIKLQLNDTIVEGSLRAGLYSYVIEKGTFGDANFGEYCADPAKFLASGRTKADCHTNLYTYYILTVDNQRADQGDTPEPGEETPSPEVLSKARQLVALSGPGYPSLTSASRTALQRYVNSEKGSDDVFRSLMNDYVKETVVELPAAGKYYTIAGVSADGTAAYVKYNAGLLSLTNDPSQAGIFKASGSTTLQTLEGKYISVLTISGMSDTYDISHNLLLERLHVSGVSDSLTFGLLSMTGLVNNFSVSARVNTATSAITTAINAPLTFTNTETSGFRFKEVAEEDIPVPPLSYALDPAAGSMVDSITSVTLSIRGGENVTLVNADLITLSGGSIVLKPVVQQLDASTFLLNFNKTDFKVGEITLTVKSGAFTYKYLSRIVESQAFTATYRVIQHPSDDIYQLAKNMLDQKGIGYPSATSAARDALGQLVATNIGNDQTFINAMLNFQAETDVELPHADCFYRIGIPDTKYNKKYLSYVDGVVGLVDYLSDAAVFKVNTSEDGSMSFQTFDGKYLSMLNNGSSNVNDVETFFTTARLKVDEVADKDTYGRLSLSSAGSFATIDVLNSMILNARQSPEFTEGVTSAFSFTEVDKAVIAPDITLSAEPANNGIVQRLDTVVLKFNSALSVQLADASKIVLTDLDGNVITPKDSIKEKDENVYTLSFINLEATYYNLSIARGAFTVGLYGEQEPIQEMTLSYQVKEVPVFVSGYQKDVDLTWEENPDNDYVMDSDLNRFTLISKAPLSLNPNKFVVIRDYRDKKEVGRGLLKDLNENRDDAPADNYRYVLELEHEIAEGSLSTGVYEYIVEAEAFGDNNYGRYLVDSMSVAKADCHVNDQLIYRAMVDNVQASIISDVTYAMSPVSGEVESLEVVTLTFNTDEKVTLADSLLLTLTPSTGSAVKPISIKQINNNAFELTFINLNKGFYNLIIGTGAFTMNYHGRERQIQEFTVTYYLTKSVDFVVGYEKEIELTWQQNPMGQYVKDSDLDKFTLLSNTPLALNPENVVVIRDSTTHNEIARGHMVIDPVDNARGNVGATVDYAYSLVMDLPKQIEDGSLPASTYEYVLAKETFGDATYGDYLVNSMKVSKADCHVNSEMKFTVKVDNKIAVGIREVGADADDAPVYDVYGRKVSGQLKKGQIYIKNGKKFMKK